ncbi:hypothetical protein LTR06_011370 [Exophiala xenobiotica]|nr:hypothetical protein LTR06_011370 [Exophiala xenobiotica]
MLLQYRRRRRFLKFYWVNFQGADEPSEGKYEISIPLDYVLDRANDVLLAYEMNDTKLPADHGFPVRLLIPGFVGGRSVKWLARIWISDEENQSYYHIWDNRQNLNSVIVHPGQGEKLNILDLLKKGAYRIEGYAYDGGGHEVQRVEISLDHGKSWLYSIYVNAVKIIDPDYLLDTGVMHLIDTTLNPDDTFGRPPQPNSTSADSSSSSTSSLSTGAKAGFGIGIAIGGLLVLFLAIFLLRRHKRHQQCAAIPQLDSREKGGAYEVQGKGLQTCPTEVPGDQAFRGELESTTERSTTVHELD